MIDKQSPFNGPGLTSMTVFIVTSGFYSDWDYGVDGVFSTKKKAEDCITRLKKRGRRGGNIEELVVDMDKGRTTCMTAICTVMRQSRRRRPHQQRRLD